MLTATFRCPFCLGDELEVKIREEPGYRCLGWECSGCRVMGVVGMVPQQATDGEPTARAVPTLSDAERALMLAMRNGARESADIRAAAGVSIMTWMGAGRRLVELGFVRSDLDGEELTAEGRRYLAETGAAAPAGGEEE